MKPIGLAFLISLISSVCFAQGSVNQTGSVVNGHAVRWFDDRTIGDAGPASGGNANVGITELAIVGKGLPFCIYDAPITNAAGYHSMCLGHTRDTFVFVFDGVEYEFPFVKGGMIGNSPSNVGDIMCFGNHQGTFAIKCGDPAPVTDPPNYGRITNLLVTGDATVQGTLTINILSLTGCGIRYPALGSSNLIGFSWKDGWIRGHVDCDGYVHNLATTDWVSDNFPTKTDLNGYATQAWVLSQGYITAAALSGYATQAWVLAQGYLTSANLAGYATESWVLSRGFVTGGPYMPANIDCGIGYERWPPVHPVGFSWDNSKLHVHVDCTDTPGTLATEQWVLANVGGGGGMPLAGRDLIVHNYQTSGIGRNEMLLFQYTHPEHLYGEWKSLAWQMADTPAGADSCLSLNQTDVNGGYVATVASFCIPYSATAPGVINFGVTGTVSGSNISPPSDTGLKKNVEPYTHGLAELKQLNTISFQYNGQGPTKDDGITRYGVMAPDVEAILPELVTMRTGTALNVGEYRTVDVPGFTWVLINAVKELESRLVAAEAKATQLEANVKKLQSQKKGGK